MLQYFIEFSVKNKLIVGLFTIVLILWGSYSFTQLPIDAVPDITNNQVLVLTTTPSLAAQEVERLITYPIEQSMLNIPGLIELRSFSRFGLSNITIVFDDQVDVYWARQQVAERLNQVKSQIPPDVGEPSMGPVTTGLGEIFQYVVRPKPGYEAKYSLTELRTIQDWIVRRQLLGTPGVADVSSFGGALKQYEISIDPDKLKSLGITISELFTALEKNNQNTGGSYIEKGPTLLFIRSEGLVGSIADIEQIVIKNTASGIPILVKDVAKVQIGTATRYGATVFNDQGEVAGAIVMMLKGENSSRVIKEVKKRIAEIEKTLPEGVMIEPFLDRTKMVNNAIRTVSKNLIEGALIVIGVLILFLGNLRAGLVVASVIPLAMLFAVSMMNLFGVSGNLMSLGAIDFGLIVDGAVIIVEAVMHHLGLRKATQALSQQEMDEQVVEVSSRIRNAAAFGEIIILIVYLPILFLVGIEGKMFAPMAQTVIFCIMGAFILSLTYVPMMSSLVLSKKSQHHKTISDRLMDRLLVVYQQVLNIGLRHPKVTVASTLLAFALSIGVFSQLGGEFIPELEEGDFAVDTRVLTGSSLPTTIESTRKAAGILKSRFPEVEKVVTKIGSGEIPTDPMPIEASDMMVILKEREEWTSAKTFEEMANKMSEAMQEIPGITMGFQYPVQMRFNELMTGARQDVVCKIFGENLDTLAHYAQRLGGVINSVEGAKDLYVEQVTGLPQIVVNYDRSAMARYGLSVSDVNKVIRTAFAGESAGLVYEGEKRYDVVVRLSSSLRQELRDVQQLLIATPTGQQIPLYQVAEVVLQEGPNQIQREFGKRRIIVGFNVRGRDVESIVNELETKVNTSLKLPAGYSISYGGQFENLQEAKDRLMIVVPMALLLILLLLYFAFGEIRYGILIFSSIPLSAIGGIFALWLRGMPFSISAGVGFIALFGVAVLNGIVLVTEFNRLRKTSDLSLLEVIKHGTAVRLRPVLMTAAVASLGFLPMALSFSAGSEVQRPLATVVIGGLVSATLLTLIVLPILYLWLESRHTRIKPAAMLLVLSALWGSSSFAQSPSPSTISLQDAVSRAVENNLRMKQARTETERQQALLPTAKTRPKTSVNLESGSFNSAYFDTRLSVGQAFAMPKVYQDQRKLQEQLLTSAQQREALQAYEIVKLTKRYYYELVYAFLQQKHYAELDSIYQNAVLAAQVRLKTGEGTQLELSTVSARKGQVQQWLSQQARFVTIAQERLRWILNDHTAPTIPQTLELPSGLKVTLDSTLLSQHPFLKVLEQEINISTQQVQVQRNVKLPEWNLGYNNQSLRGYQRINDVDRFYGGWHRFSSFQVGISLPLFGKNAFVAKEKASLLDLKASEIAYQQAQQQLSTELKVLAESYYNERSNLKYFEEIALMESKQLAKDAHLSLQNGSINYLDWLVLVNESLGIKQRALDARWALTTVILELESLLNPINH